MTRNSRLAIGIAALALIAGYFTPIWRIDLSAPQYPEGLSLTIWIDRLGGDVDKINGLNHYIGMAHIKAEQFSEFLYMKYVLGGIIALGLLAAVIGRRGLAYSWVLALIAMSGLALYDMWQWGYQYGHNLDPKAAISIPDMTYQPPLIGFKQLLNFGAWSLPDIGGWVLGGALVVGLAVSSVELCLSRPNASNFFCRWLSRRAAQPRPVGV